jgi:hypothetical protein
MHLTIGSGNGRQLNQLEVCIARRDRRWPRTQLLKIYIGLGNRALRPVRGQSVVLLEPRCSLEFGELQACE